MGRRRVRSSTSIATVLGLTAVAGIGATALIYAVTNAAADASGSDPDQAIATNRLEMAMPPLTKMEAVERKAEDAQVLQSALHPKPTPIQWAEGASSETAAWAQPRLNGIASFAGKYEPRFDLHRVSKGDTDQSQIEVSLQRKAAPNQPMTTRLGFASQTSPKVRQKGHWFVFAAGGSNAVGLNLLNDPQGQLRRAGWSSGTRRRGGSGSIGHRLAQGFAAGLVRGGGARTVGLWPQRQREVLGLHPLLQPGIRRGLASDLEPRLDATRRRLRGAPAVGRTSLARGCVWRKKTTLVTKNSKEDQGHEEVASAACLARPSLNRPRAARSENQERNSRLAPFSLLSLIFLRV